MANLWVFDFPNSTPPGHRFRTLLGSGHGKLSLWAETLGRGRPLCSATAGSVQEARDFFLGSSVSLAV